MSISNDNPNLFIEKTIETKFNQLISDLPKIIKPPPDNNPDFFNLSINQIFQETIQTIIDIIQEIVNVIDTSYNYQSYIKRLSLIFFKEKRMFYLGIILIILSFIIYFIDGATI
jgi:hypothetical protein